MVTEIDYARMRDAQTTSRRMWRKWYEKNRLLENAVRELVRGAKFDDLMGAYVVEPHVIESINRRVPIKPRKKFGRR